MEYSTVAITCLNDLQMQPVYSLHMQCTFIEEYKVIQCEASTWSLLEDTWRENNGITHRNMSFTYHYHHMILTGMS